MIRCDQMRAGWKRPGHRVLACVLLAVVWVVSPLAFADPPSVGPCGGVTPDDAAAILKIPASDIVGPKTNKAFTCIYRSKRDFYTRVTFNIYVTDSPTKAAHALAAEKEDLAFLSPIKPLPNLGDEAYRAPDSRARRLLMRKGRVWLDVVTPGDAASQRHIARIVLKHLP